MRYILPTLAMFVATQAIAQETPKSTITDTEKAVAIAAGNDFATDLYGKLKAEKGNVFFSPESLSQALAMTLAGAKDTTASEMQTVLHLQMSSDYIAATMSELIKEKNARSASGAYTLQTANAVWVQKDYELLPSYTSLLKDNYDANASNVDFEKDAPGAADTINRWVEGKTQSRIKDLVSANALTNVRLVLTNAVYFKADWQNPFEKSATHEEDFYVNPAQTSRAWMMRRTCNDCTYADNDILQAVAIPYKGGDIEMVVLLPRDRGGMDAFEQSLTPQMLNNVLGELKRGVHVDIALPRFRLESQYSFSKILPELGMKAAFDPEHADFSGMTGKRELYISDVVQKAFVEVDEQGTEAAAATAVMAGVSSVPVVKEFRADHPFIFLLRDAKNGAIYFMGRMQEPMQSLTK